MSKALPPSRWPNGRLLRFDTGSLSGQYEGPASGKHQVQGEQQNPRGEKQNAETNSKGFHCLNLPLRFILLGSATVEHRHYGLVLISRYVPTECEPNRRDEKERQPKSVV